MRALYDFDTYLYGDKADEKKDALQVSLLAKMQAYRPSGVSAQSCNVPSLIEETILNLSCFLQFRQFSN